MLKTSPVEEANQGDFLKFNSRDGLFKNFMENFLKQFNEPKHLGLYKVLADNVEQVVANLKTILQNKHPSPRQSAEDKRHSTRFRRLPTSAEERHSHQSRSSGLEDA